MKKYITLTIFFFLSFIDCIYAQDATVRLIAGSLNNTAGFAGDGGPDTTASFNKIKAICTDAHENIYIFDQGNYRIRKIDATTHTVSTIAGNGTTGFSGDGGPAINAQIGDGTVAPYYNNGTSGIAVDAVGNVYFSDLGNGRIRKIDTFGIITTIAGGGSSLGNGIAATDADILPQNLFIKDSGHIYFSDARRAVRKIDINTGLIYTIYGSLSESPYRQAFSGFKNDIYVIDYDNSVLKIDSAGATELIIGDPAYANANFGSGMPAKAATLAWGGNITIDTSGNIYAGDMAVVRKVNRQTGFINSIAGRERLAYDRGVWGGGYPGSGPGLLPHSADWLGFQSYSTPIHADSLGQADQAFASYASRSSKLYIFLENSIVLYTPPAYVINKAIMRDTLLSASCTMPATRAYGFYGTLSGRPAPGDSLHLRINLDGVWTFEATSITLPFYSYVNPSGDTVYAFGDSINYWLGERTFTTYNLYKPVVHYNNHKGVSDFAEVLDTVGTVCNHALDLIFENEPLYTITSSPCAPTAHVVFNIYGSVGSLRPGVSPVTQDSLSIRISFNDGTEQVVMKDLYGTGGGFSVEFEHDYPAGGTYGYAISYVTNAGLGYNVAEAFLIDIPAVSVPDAGIITGAGDMCAGGTITLVPSAPDGVWSSTSGVSVASDGHVTGLVAGVDTVTYTVSNECSSAFVISIITVNALPVAGITTGPPSVCPAATTTLSNSTTGGSWSSSSANATVSGGVVTGVTTGTSIISYSVTNGCGTAVDTILITINQVPDAGVITGTNNVCPSAIVTLSNTATGGTWSSSSANASVTGGLVTGIIAGDAIISYSVTNTCGTATDTVLITINALPDAGIITGTNNVCVATATTLSNAVTGGLWTSSTTSSATVSGGIVYGATAGSTIISYSVTNICGTATDTMLVTVNPLPDAGTITGISSVCAGNTTTLINTTGGGTWSSSTVANATVSGGLVTGVAAGTSVISYAVSNACGTVADTMLFTVNPLPDAGTITGTNHVCVGGSVTLTNAATGGTWLASTSTADVTDGVVTGLSAGNVVIFYTVTNTCGTAEDTMAMVVNAVPDAGTITGTSFVCTGGISTLFSGATGGTWSSSNTAIATISSSGVVSAITTGLVTFSYVLSNSCGADTATFNVDVHTVPDAGTITGTDTLCPGAVATLSASTTGIWTSSDYSVADISSSGVVTGVSSGSATIVFLLSDACGNDTASYTITVLPLTACPDNVSTMPGNTSLTLYPNPNDGTFSIVGTWPGSDRVVTVEIVNVLGQTAYKNTATVTNGELKVLLQTTNLATGSYLVRLSDGGQMQTLRCTVSK